MDLTQRNMRRSVAAALQAVSVAKANPSSLYTWTRGRYFNGDHRRFIFVN